MNVAGRHRRRRRWFVTWTHHSTTAMLYYSGTVLANFGMIYHTTFDVFYLFIIQIGTYPIFSLKHLRTLVCDESLLLQFRH